MRDYPTLHLDTNKMNCELMLTYDTPAYMFNVYKNQPSWQTGSRNLMVTKTLPIIWGTYMKLVTKYQISAINSCWEKCAYMFNVYKNQLRDTKLKGNHPGTIPARFGLIWFSGFRGEDLNAIFYQNMPNLHNRYISAERKISQNYLEYMLNYSLPCSCS